VVRSVRTGWVITNWDWHISVLETWMKAGDAKNHYCSCFTSPTMVSYSWNSNLHNLWETQVNEMIEENQKEFHSLATKGKPSCRVHSSVAQVIGRGDWNVHFLIMSDAVLQFKVAKMSCEYTFHVPTRVVRVVRGSY
jgi:hypothetical protein